MELSLSAGSMGWGVHMEGVRVLEELTQHQTAAAALPHAATQIQEVSLDRANSAYARFVKPTVDRITAPIIGIVVLPICIVVAAAIRLSMGKQVLFRQLRVGRDGEPFQVLKFRTMHHDRRARRDEIDFDDRRITHKHPHDPRLTALGRFLRKWSLDELPQIWNVIRGDISFIGPRPELVAIVDRYEPWQHARHAVRPGMTGLWQVAERGNRPMQECVDIDISYVEQLSPWLDLRIAAMTPLVMLGRGKGF
jgi:lipopolysaccharide/colanic/teichoic acid biosynthesis glycosyltransferase